MTQYNFDAGAQGWTGDLSFKSDDGSPAPGCLNNATQRNSTDSNKTGLSIPVNTGDPMSFRVKLTADGAVGEHSGTVTVIMTVSGVPLAEFQTQFVLSVGNYPYDSGWIQVSDVASAAGTADEIHIAGHSSNEDLSWSLSIDTVFVAEADGAANARFYHSLAAAALVQKFTLPWLGVKPGAMTIDKILGTVVFGSNIGANPPVIYSQNPYASSANFASGYPSGTTVTSLKWI